RRAQAYRIIIAPIWADAVRRPVHHDRVRGRRRGVLRDIYCGEQLHTITHRDPVLRLGVARLDEVGETSRPVFLFLLALLFARGLLRLRSAGLGGRDE